MDSQTMSWGLCCRFNMLIILHAARIALLHFTLRDLIAITEDPIVWCMTIHLVLAL